MAFVVGNKTFSSLRDAQAYLDSLQEFGGGGSITPFDTSLLTGSGDRTSTGMFTNDQEMSPEEFASGVTAPAFITGSSGGDAFRENLIDIPRFEDLPGQDPFRNMADRLFQQFIEQTQAEDDLQKWIRRNVLNDSRDPEDQDVEPSDLDTLFADDTFQQIWDSIIGTIGDVPPEIRGDELKSQQWYNLQIQNSLQAIEDAGGYEAWLEQQETDEPEGPPEELPTELEEEVDIDADTTLEDEIGVEPDMPIDIPFPDLPPREEGEGDSEGNGNGADGQQEAAQGEGDNEEYQLPDYGDIGQDYEPPLPRGQGGTIYDVPIQDDPGFTVGLGVPVLGSIGSGGGDGGNGGGGGGGVASTGMLTPRFNPYMASIGYTPVAVPKPILPQAPIVSSLFSEFLS